LELALEVAAVIEEEALVRIPTEHFVRWIAVIDALSAGAGEGEDADITVELDQIIREVRQDHDQNRS
jgi:hypothetical protein